ncbi:hypothetical protein Ccrd_024327, partial [Cynara cardunculus var. scolymus]
MKKKRSSFPTLTSRYLVTTTRMLVLLC